ncbi:hypothetical protein IK110_02860 [Candidatus Saccharibacteria bacterium]|nr:hypothetical protein [Candidatus Saccharibacteria bacterium]
MAKNKIFGKKQVVLLAVLGILLAALAIAVIVFLSKPRGIDCMPPMSESEQACLDSGRCYCETY